MLQDSDKNNSYRFESSFAEHGNEIEEIISKQLPFVIRWGGVFFLFLLTAIGLVCWFIKYPDIVIANAKLSSINGPKPIVSRTDGKLILITVQENSLVQKEQVIGYMESIANPKAILQIHAKLDSIINLIQQNRTNEIVKIVGLNSGNSAQSKEDDLGELQAGYQSFVQAFSIFKGYLLDGYYQQKRKMLTTDMDNARKLHSILISQKYLLEKDLTLAKETFNASESLAKEKVISSLDYRNEKSKVITKELSLPQIKGSIINNEGQQNDKLKEIAELENQINLQENLFKQVALTFKSQLQSWEYKYILKAPVDGKISFAGFFQTNQEVKLGQLLFYVQPDNTSYFAEILIPQYNFGKVKSDQKVLLKLRAYPFEQYGLVAGRIDFINGVPTDSGYLAKVNLTKGLVTNYNIPLKYTNGLIAEADIVTEETRLLQKFYYNFIKRLKR